MLSGYGEAMAKAKASARPMRGTKPDRIRSARSKDKVGGKRPQSLLSNPVSEKFVCGETRFLIAFYYFERSARRLTVKQMRFKLEVDTHLCAPDGCDCKGLLGLINRYMDCWWREVGIPSGLRVSTVDSDRITDDEINLIASAVDGWLLLGRSARR